MTDDTRTKRDQIAALKYAHELGLDAEMEAHNAAIDDALAILDTPTARPVGKVVSLAFVLEALHGIDLCVTDTADANTGWWDTSTGAKFGADVLARIEDAALLPTHADEPAPVAVEGDFFNMDAVRREHAADLAPTGNTALAERLRAKGDGPEANMWNAALDAVIAALSRPVLPQPDITPCQHEAWENDANGWPTKCADCGEYLTDAERHARGRLIAPQPTPEVDELVARLRRFAIREGYSGVVAANQAADRIEQLEAENAELRGKLERAEKTLTTAMKLAAMEMREQANIRSPVQSEIREPYEGEDGA